MVAPDGEVALAGWSSGPGSGEQDATAVLFTAGGVLDDGYGNGGQVIQPGDLGPVTAAAFTPAVQLVLAGVNLSGDITEVVTLAADGSGPVGMMAWSGPGPGEPVVPYGVRVDASGRTVVTGRYLGDGDLAALRFRSNGQLDTTFGTGGFVDVGWVTGATAGAGLAWTAAGDLLAAGSGAAVAFAPDTPPAVVPADRLYAEQDADYNTTSLTDASGVVVQRYAYGAYGSVTVLNPDGSVRGDGSAMSSQYGWVYLHQGLRLDVVTGTYSARNRVYDVDLDRWLQEDPEGYVDGSNRYQFELSTPGQDLDPSGTMSWSGFVNLVGGGLAVSNAALGTAYSMVVPAATAAADAAEGAVGPALDLAVGTAESAAAAVSGSLAAACTTVAASGSTLATAGGSAVPVAAGTGATALAVASPLALFASAYAAIEMAAQGVNAAADAEYYADLNSEQAAHNAAVRAQLHADDGNDDTECDDGDDDKDPRRIYEWNPKHPLKGQRLPPKVSPAPIDGQDGLNGSVQVKPTNPERVGRDSDGDPVVFPRHFRDLNTGDEYFHGYCPGWDGLDDNQKNKLIGAGLFNRRGKPL